MQVWVHTLVKNEQRYLWYSVQSVIDFVDRLLLWDTGSTDGTLDICQALKRKYPKKIDFRRVQLETAQEFSKVRQEMLDKTDADWFLIVDGDEVWWDDSILEIVETIQKCGKTIESIVAPNFLIVGDIFHYQEAAAGRYRFAGRVGHYNQRAFRRNIPGLKSVNPHGTWGWADLEGRMIQDRDPNKIAFVEAPYLHFSFVQRAGERQKDLSVIKRKQKLKHEIGISFPKDFYYPEVFFRQRPQIVPSPWVKMNTPFFAKALLETPLRKIKRRVFRGGVGY